MGNLFVIHKDILRKIFREKLDRTDLIELTDLCCYGLEVLKAS